ncbi:hypothetical protein [Microbacterium gorillae]|uniref:hypothetical protein n=1 Tax=Microbacterium gorillae TaxID=1231063 RepID=UPI000590C92B|nr:hypothetical protein [Microbacterium gorillae]
MRRPIVLSSLAVALLLTGCSAGGDDETVSDPTVAGTTSATAAPDITSATPLPLGQFDADGWARTALGAGQQGDSVKSEVLETGHPEQVSLTQPDGAWRVDLICAGNGVVHLTATLTVGGKATETAVACATSPEAKPTPVTLTYDGGPTVTLDLTVDAEALVAARIGTAG